MKCHNIVTISFPRDRRSGYFVFVYHCVILSFYKSVSNLNLADNFSTVRARALIFQIRISCDKTLPCDNDF